MSSVCSLPACNCSHFESLPSVRRRRRRLELRFAFSCASSLYIGRINVRKGCAMSPRRKCTQTTTQMQRTFVRSAQNLSIKKSYAAPKLQIFVFARTVKEKTFQRASDSVLTKAKRTRTFRRPGNYALASVNTFPHPAFVPRVAAHKRVL